MVDDGRRDMKGDGDGWYLWCCTRTRRPTRCQFLLCLFTWESPFGGVCIHMQYIIHGCISSVLISRKIDSCFPGGACAERMDAGRMGTRRACADIANVMCTITT